MKFEESIKELETIVQSMESGKISIDDSLDCFYKGVKICQDCSKQLEEAKGKVTILQKQMESLIEKPFDGEGNND